jgi:hypothetical protein
MGELSIWREHWDHLRPSNPIESVFATVRHRTVRTKGALSAKTAKLMVFKLVTAAANTWRRLKGENQLPKVVQGVKFQTASRSSKCRLTTPPDRSRHPISRIAPSTASATAPYHSTRARGMSARAQPRPVPASNGSVHARYALKAVVWAAIRPFNSKRAFLFC